MQNNYTPFSSAPYPSAGLGVDSGMREAQADMMLRQAQELGLANMLLGNQRAGAELERFQGMTPHELEKAAYEAALAKSKRTMPGYIPQVLQGDMGEAQSKAATGQYDQGVVGGRISAQNSQNNLSSMIAGLMRLKSMGAMNPAMAQAAYQDFLRSIPDDNLRNQMPAMFSPQGVDMALDALSRTPEAIRSMREGDAERTSREGIGAANNATSIRVAEINADARMQAAYARLQAFMGQNKQNFQQFLTQYAQKKAMGQATPQDDLMAQMIEQMLYQSRFAPGGAIDPNAPMQQIFPNIGPRATPPSAIPTPQGAPGSAQNPIKLD